MPQCIQSIDNRFFVEIEGEYGTVPSISEGNQFSGTRLRLRQQVQQRVRRDKTGTRTFAGVAPGSRRVTSFELQSYHTENLGLDPRPRTSPLIQSAMGAGPSVASSMALSASSTTTVLQFLAAHDLAVGDAVVFNDELRFVKQVLSASSIETNAPLDTAPGSGEQTRPAASYAPASELPSVSLFDYWEPETAVSRIAHGVVCDTMSLVVNGDFHALEFTGQAQGIIDNVSFSEGNGGLSSFPLAPAGSTTLGQPVPGNLGQAWLGSPTNRFLTVVGATISVSNDIRLRANEFGASEPQCIVPGRREVTLDLELLEADDAATRDLYSAGVSESGVPIMLQAGSTAGQLAGVYMPNVVPDIPEFDDSERLLSWRFRSARATGVADDEIYFAFG